MFIKSYDAVKEMYKNKEITLADWQNFCTYTLEELMDKRREILENLKEK